MNLMFQKIGPTGMLLREAACEKPTVSLALVYQKKNEPKRLEISSSTQSAVHKNWSQQVECQRKPIY